MICPSSFRTLQRSDSTQWYLSQPQLCLCMHVMRQPQRFVEIVSKPIGQAKAGCLCMHALNAWTHPSCEDCPPPNADASWHSPLRMPASPASSRADSLSTVAGDFLHQRSLLVRNAIGKASGSKPRLPAVAIENGWKCDQDEEKVRVLPDGTRWLSSLMTQARLAG